MATIYNVKNWLWYEANVDKVTLMKSQVFSTQTDNSLNPQAGLSILNHHWIRSLDGLKHLTGDENLRDDKSTETITGGCGAKAGFMWASFCNFEWLNLTVWTSNRNSTGSSIRGWSKAKKKREYWDEAQSWQVARIDWNELFQCLCDMSSAALIWQL